MPKQSSANASDSALRVAGLHFGIERNGVHMPCELHQLKQDRNLRDGRQMDYMETDAIEPTQNRWKGPSLTRWVSEHL